MTRPLNRIAVGHVVVALAALGACSSDGRELTDPVFPPPATTTTTPTTTPTTPPFAVAVAAELPAEPTEPPVVSTTTRPNRADGSCSIGCTARATPPQR